MNTKKKGEKKPWERPEGFPRLPSKFGSVVALSKPETRRNPVCARITEGFDERGYPQYKVIAYCPDWMSGYQALVNYHEYEANILEEMTFDQMRKYLQDLIMNKTVMPVVTQKENENSSLTYAQVYEKFREWKYEKKKKKYSQQTKWATQAGYKNSADLHDKIFVELTTEDLQNTLDKCPLKHASLEHIKNLYNQMYKYAIQANITDKNFAQYVEISIPDDDKEGVPFEEHEIKLFWKNKDKPFVDAILILIYSGWRISELLMLDENSIDLEQNIWTSGVKTANGKNRTIPIHSKIQDIVRNRLKENPKFFDMHHTIFRNQFKDAVAQCGIKEEHTPHDCRHTFGTLLDNAGANEICKRIMIGHSKKSVTEKYTHKSITELRKAIELI